MSINSPLGKGFWLILLLTQPMTSSWAHPGSGIVVDEGGYVWFMDTGYGLWQVDPSGHMTAQAGIGGHFLAIDRQERYEQKHFATLAAGDVEVARLDPRLIVATSYPVAFGSDGAIYFPQVAGTGRVRMMRMNPGKSAEPFADLPPIREISGSGEMVDVEWVWGIAAGPDGSIYYTEQQAVRRIAHDGTVSTVAENVVVPDCERPEALRDAPSNTNLYGLDVATDGTVYVAASGCSAVLKISPDGVVTVAARSTDRWSPMGVAVIGDTLYVLEYDYVDSDDRADWFPRVRRIDADGVVTILAQVDRRPEQARPNLTKLSRNIVESVLQPPRTHAAIVHFPIALLVISIPIAFTAIVVRRRGLLQIQLLVIFVALLTACLASESTGEIAERQIPFGADGPPGVAWEYLRQHTTYASYLKLFAVAGLLVSAATLLLGVSRETKAIRLAMSLVVLAISLGGSVAAIVAAHYGGELVYGQGLGSQTLMMYLQEKSRTNQHIPKVLPGPPDTPLDDQATASLVGKLPGEERTIAGTPLCWCPPGRFDMGSPLSEPERRPFEFQVTVALTKGFWTGKYEVTQGDWRRVVGELPGETTQELPAGDQYPVGNVNFAEAERYCEKLTELAVAARELPPGWEFRLPTEAQWEYACRAGTTTATSFGNRISSQEANTKGDQPYNGAESGPTLGRAAPVGSYPANPWGIHDMHGNTCEWCRDWAHWRYPGGVDPDLHDSQATASRNEAGSYSRSRRGSCWADPAWASRSAFRQRFEPERRYDHIGFRVLLVKIQEVCTAQPPGCDLIVTSK